MNTQKNLGNSDYRAEADENRDRCYIRKRKEFTVEAW